MLGLGWTEMLVVGIVALIVIGPKDLPMVMQRIGKFAGQIRRMGNEFQREINRTTGLDEVRNLRQSITEPLRKSTEEIRREFNTMTPNGPKPSGALKPADPGKESVADEIRAAAGIPAEQKSAAATPPTKQPVKAAKVTKPKPESSKPAPASTATKADPAPKKSARKTPAKAAGNKATVKAELSPRAAKSSTKSSAAKKPAAEADNAETPAKPPRTRKSTTPRRKPAKAESSAGEA